MPDYKFWNARWETSQIGFHQSAPHKSLMKYSNVFKGHQNIFVPLCGKSLDMIFLREQGHEVIGVEFSEIAVLDFIKENNLSMTKKVLSHFNLYQGEGLTIYQGDLFNLSSVELKGVSAIYDRASMVAFSFSERLRYSQFLIQQATDLEIILSPLLDYGDLAEGQPPFSVTEKELLALYGESFKLEELSREEVPARDTLKARGAAYEREVTWLFSKRK